MLFSRTHCISHCHGNLSCKRLRRISLENDSLLEFLISINSNFMDDNAGFMHETVLQSTNSGIFLITNSCVTCCWWDCLRPTDVSPPVQCTHDQTVQEEGTYRQSANRIPTHFRQSDPRMKARVEMYHCYPKHTAGMTLHLISNPTPSLLRTIWYLPSKQCWLASYFFTAVIFSK